MTLLWVLLAISSTEARVRTTDISNWLRPGDGGWTYLNAVTIQGAARHAAGPGPTVVLVGPSFLASLLPPRDQLAEAYASAGVASTRVVGLAADALSLEECAAIVDKFGADFDGWFVIHVNRHTLARDMEDRESWKRKAGLLVGFHSPVLTDERVRSGRPISRPWGIPLLDFPRFYLQSLGGWRPLLFPWKLGFGSRKSERAQRIPPTQEEILAQIPPSASGAQTHSFEVLGRVAERLRASGRARLAIVEVPFADEVTLEVQTEAWRAARATFALQRSAWSQAHGVPWLDITDKLRARPEDFGDARHVSSAAVTARFTAAVSQWLAAPKP